MPQVECRRMAEGAKEAMQVTLNANEVLVAGYVGMRRNAEANFRNRKPRFPERVKGELWGFHIESAHAELAVSKVLGVYWGFGVNTFHTSDISGKSIEVRWSSRNDLKVRPDDDGIVISVSGSCPTYTINGWIEADQAKRQEFLFNQEPICYFVPHKYLKPIEGLCK